MNAELHCHFLFRCVCLCVCVSLYVFASVCVRCVGIRERVCTLHDVYASERECTCDCLRLCIYTFVYRRFKNICICISQPIHHFPNSCQTSAKSPKRQHPGAERTATVDATKINKKTNNKRKNKTQETKFQNTYSNKKKLYNRFTALITRSVIPDS